MVVRYAIDDSRILNGNGQEISIHALAFQLYDDQDAPIESGHNEYHFLILSSLAGSSKRMRNSRNRRFQRVLANFIEGANSNGYSPLKSELIACRYYEESRLFEELDNGNITYYRKGREVGTPTWYAYSKADRLANLIRERFQEDFERHHESFRGKGVISGKINVPPGAFFTPNDEERKRFESEISIEYNGISLPSTT